MGSNLDTLVSIGLDEKFPPDYRLAQQVCHAITNISDRRKVCGVVTSKPKRVGILLFTLSTHPQCLPTLHSLRWANVTLPSGCRRNTACLSDCGRWSQRVSYSQGPSAELGPLSAVATCPFSCAGIVHPDPLWIPFKEAAVTLIYQLAEGPEAICAQMLQGCAKQALEKLEEKSPPQEAPSKWAEGSMGPWAVNSFCFTAEKKPLPPPLPIMNPDPLSPHCPFLSLRLGQSLPPSPSPSSLASSLGCRAHEQGAISANRAGSRET